MARSIHNILKYEVNVSRQKWTVWVGLCGCRQVIGAFFFRRNVTGHLYLQMITEDVLPQLEGRFERQVQGVFKQFWWIHDGAIAHRLIAVRDRPRELFGYRVVALNR